MTFLTISLIVHAPDHRTGAQNSTHDRFQEVVHNAVLSEEPGFDGDRSHQQLASEWTRR